MSPFGEALDYSLKHARVDPDRHFHDLSVEKVKKGAGWKRIDHLPSLWKDQ